MARTQRVLHEALITLLLERGWDEVNVREICERADVGRSTFYVHFADKEELLLKGFDLLQAALREHVKRAEGQPLAFIGPLIEHVRAHQRVWRALVGKRSGQAARSRLLRLISDFVEDDVPFTPRTPQRAAAVRYIAGAIVELLVWWIDARATLERQELELLLRRLTAPLLAQVSAL